ncbi:MAG: membrane protein insertase YidC [Gammaproteobacteria bacterium]|nr:membrane protein insertase YidC [Gammaproteobacteria bacterium]
MLTTEIQRIVLLIALGVVGYLLLQAWTRDYGQASEEPPPLASPLPIADDPVAGPSDDLPSSSAPGDVPGDDLAVPATRGIPEPTVTVADERLVRVHTPTLDLAIDLLGGDIVELRLPKYPAVIDEDRPVQLLERSRGHTYIAQSGLIGRDGRDRQDTRPLYSAGARDYTLDDGGGSLTVALTHHAEGVTVVKRFLFEPDDYLVTVEYDIDNAGTTEYRGQLFAQLKRDSTRPDASGTFMGPRPYVGAAFTTPESRYEKVDFEDLDDGQFRIAVAGGWAAVLQHYFLTAWVGAAEEVNAYYGRRLGDGNYAVGFIAPEIVVPPGRSETVAARFYAGPKIQKRLEAIAPNLNLTVDYGFLWWLSVPLFYVLDAIHSVVLNWGIAIILLTLAVKILLFPLASVGFRSMAKMKQVMPQMKRLQERHAGDRQKLSQEMMALYRKEGANPFGGCLPLLLQMPVFFALYWVLYESVELRQAPFMLWINDLAAPDPWFVLPILYGASFFLMQLLNPPPPDPMQARVMKTMPILFTVLFVFFPAGLVLYWLVNNILSLAQQWYITRKIEAASATKSS